jgi:hypothetical protein
MVGGCDKDRVRHREKVTEGGPVDSDTDLVEAGYLERGRVRRQAQPVHLNLDQTMRHDAQPGHEIGGLLTILALDATSTNPPPTEQP